MRRSRGSIIGVNGRGDVCYSAGKVSHRKLKHTGLFGVKCSSSYQGICGNYTVYNRYSDGEVEGRGGPRDRRSKRPED